MEKKYYHVNSDGMEKEIVFSAVEDFVTGVNDAAVCSLGFEVTILCYCLMSNHFHFVLYGSYEECSQFCSEYKRRCAIRMRQNGGKVKALQNMKMHISAIDDEEYLLNAVAYVLRNPIAARIMAMPHHYPWSSANAYFRWGGVKSGEPVNQLTERKRFRILKSKIDVPDSFRIDAKGMILPECFVDYSHVEKVFGHPSRLLVLLAKRLEADVELRLGIVNQMTVTDAELQTRLLELIQVKYQVASISQLTREQKIRLCSDMRRNFGASAKQIARILRIDIAVVEKVI